MFPKQKDVPSEFAVAPLKQKTWLLNGKLVEWKGPFPDVHSPVYINGNNGCDERQRC